jgi:hypothetical protein
VLRWSSPLGSIALVILATGFARAQTEPAAGGKTGVHLSWIRSAAAASCPDAGHVQADVVRRLGSDPFTEPSRLFVEASVSKDGGSWQAEIEMRDASGSSLGSRKVAGDGPHCASLASAAGLAIALMIDPDAMLDHRPSPAPVEVAPKEAPARPPPAERASRRGALALSAAFAGHILPHAAFGASLAGEVRLVGRLDLAVSSTFLPEKRQSRDGNDVSFGLVWGAVGPCYRMVDVATISLSGCGALLVGALRTVVFDPVRARTSALPWAGASAGVRVGWSPVAPLLLEGGVDLIAPFYRRSYLVEHAPGDNVAVFDDPALAGAGFLGLGVQY